MARNDRQRYGNLGIYDPPEPSTRALPADAKARWQQIYDQAMATYGKKEVAESTAWRTIRMSWKQSGNTWIRCSNNRCQAWPVPRTSPKPESVLDGLGVMIEYGYVDPNGDLQVMRPANPDAPPILYWDDVGKRLYICPHAHLQDGYPTCEMIPDTPEMHAADSVYRKWAKGRASRCASAVAVPKCQIAAVGVADTISYRSDKFDGKSQLVVIDLRGQKRQDPRVPKAQEYIHKHWHDVWTWQDDEDDPWVVVIEGGALDVHSKGIIH